MSTNKTYLPSVMTLSNSTKPNIPQAMQSRSVLLRNMFDPEEYDDISVYQRELNFEQ